MLKIFPLTYHSLFAVMTRLRKIVNQDVNTKTLVENSKIKEIKKTLTERDTEKWSVRHYLY